MKIKLVIAVLSISLISSEPVLAQEWHGMSFTNNGFVINANIKKDSGNVDFWPYEDWNYFDNIWSWDRDTLRLTYANHDWCLNAFSAGQSTNVDIYTCDGTNDQNWEFVGTGNNVLIRLMNTNYCLNAYKVGKRSNLNLYTCNSADPDQIFNVKKYLPVAID